MNGKQKFFLFGGIAIIIALYFVMNSSLVPYIKEHERNRSITSLPPIYYERGVYQAALNATESLADEMTNMKTKFYTVMLVVAIISIGGTIFNKTKSNEPVENKAGSDIEKATEINSYSEEIKNKLKKLEELKENNLINDDEFNERKSELINKFLG
ncbi:hypothetical protein [Proteiniborus sp.]|uniref:hypothetical protein n=1 Tax=Proteiniborus sp. TaxID=2079015 RepID=UPI0033187098